MHITAVLRIRIPTRIQIPRIQIPRIQIPRIHVFLGLLDPDPDPDPLVSVPRRLFIPALQ